MEMHFAIWTFLMFVFANNFASAAATLVDNQNDKSYNNFHIQADNGNLFNSQINFLSTIINDARVKLSNGGHNDMQTELEKKLLDNILVDLRALRDFYQNKPKGKRLNTAILSDISDFKDQQLDEYKRSVFSALMSKTRRSHRKPLLTPTEEEEFSPSISIGEFGALVNLEGFFDSLKSNLEVIESKNLTPNQIRLLQGQNISANIRREYINEGPRPSNTAAFLHAIRNYRPSSKIRALVSMEPETYRGSNSYNPTYNRIGLGK